MKSDKNYKSRLIEWGQKKHIDVEFRIVTEELRKEGVFFVSEVLVNGEPCGIGDGFSKRESQQKAARQALAKMRKWILYLLLERVTAAFSLSPPIGGVSLQSVILIASICVKVS